MKRPYRGNGNGHKLQRIDKDSRSDHLRLMRKVGLKALRTNLEEYVRAAAGGETVLVTDNERVVAQIVPPEAANGKRSADENFAEMVREGFITPAKVRSGTPPPRSPVMSFDELMEDLARDRDGR